MNTTPILTWFACGASAVIAGAAGWALRGPTAVPQDEERHAILVPPSQHPAEKRRDTAPVISVSQDGNVTLHIEQRPLAWVLEQIELQGGRLDAKHDARGAAPVSVAAPHAPCTDPPVDAARLLQTIAHGSDAERFDGLMQARQVSLLVPDDTLKTLYENDPSDRVRLAAFGVYLERYSGEPATVRKALEDALLVPSLALQQDARQRLDELIERDRIHAASPQGTPQ